MLKFEIHICDVNVLAEISVFYKKEKHFVWRTKLRRKDLKNSVKKGIKTNKAGHSNDSVEYIFGKSVAALCKTNIKIK